MLMHQLVLMTSLHNCYYYFRLCPNLHDLLSWRNTLDRQSSLVTDRLRESSQLVVVIEIEHFSERTSCCLQWCFHRPKSGGFY